MLLQSDNLRNPPKNNKAGKRLGISGTAFPRPNKNSNLIFLEK